MSTLRRCWCYVPRYNLLLVVIYRIIIANLGISDSVVVAGRCTQGSVRTSGSNSDRYGAVEVCVNGTWGTVCNDFWDDLDARVFCRQLGYSPYGMFITFIQNKVQFLIA